MGIQVIMMHAEGLGLVEVTGVSRHVRCVRISLVGLLRGGVLSVLIGASFWGEPLWWRGGWGRGTHREHLILPTFP